MDRMFDNYVMTPMQRIVFDFIRPPEVRDPKGVEEACAMLDRAYAWLDGVMAARTWAAGGNVQPRRLRRGTVALLCRLGASHPRGSRKPEGLSRPLARAAVVRAGRG